MISPAVPNHEAKLRFFVSSEHSDEQLRTAVRATVEALRLDLTGDREESLTLAP